MSIKIHGIPNCSTCKKALQWLQDNQIDYEFINLKQQPPNRETIQNWVDTLGAKVMRNTSGKSYRALGEEKKTWPDKRWITEFSQDPMLLKRPIFVKNQRVISVGFKVAAFEAAILQ